MFDKAELDKLIIGRVEPHIYAFKTNTIPNYLKVGDTYRPVSERLNEWKTKYKRLQQVGVWSAQVNKESYFRDYSVHRFLEFGLHKKRLQSSDIPKSTYFSNEFFKDTKAEHVLSAINDIKLDYENKSLKYQFYNQEDRLAQTITFSRTENYELREGTQDVTVEKFKEALRKGRNNLLMYAVMRFGKSFTSMCCALEMKAKIVVIVSAKADVKLEWKRTVESHVKFSKYVFIESRDLNYNNNIVKKTIASGKRAAVFLTLQDLQGTKIKEKHKKIFGANIDLLLIDETHFGARAEKYGKVLQDSSYEKDVKNKKESEDFVETSEADEQIKVLKAKVKIHLSGTPYRILMSSEFKKDDIIAFFQFSDIVGEQQKWNDKYILNDVYIDGKMKGKPVKEWDNPYFGFPQMIRFAFVPNKSSRIKLQQLKNNGVTYAFSSLLKPRSIKKSDSNQHKLFVNENEVLDLFKVIDGSKDDDELLGFLDYDKIKNGSMCRHIVIVLPYCASCDALEELLIKNNDKFKNLNKYTIINISGVDKPNAFPNTLDVKNYISKCESEGKKTITLTVNRMLTGSTVPEWDTMIYLKDTSSPQEYDQAVFRLQNQYIKTYKSSSNDIIKMNLKPQTLLVDFDPNRMFSMQELKAHIYNVNIDEGGNQKLKKRLDKEISISPIVVVNKNKIRRVESIDILNAVSKYKMDRGIKEEALEIPVDLGMLQIKDIQDAINKENELGSGAGLSSPAHINVNGDDEDLDLPDVSKRSGTSSENDSSELLSLEKTMIRKIQSYYAKILLYSFITDDEILSLYAMIDSLSSEENLRISRNLGIDKTIVKKIYLYLNRNNKWTLRDLDYKIQDLNNLSHSPLKPEEKTSVAISKFGKLGDAIVTTKKEICDYMVNLLPESSFTKVNHDRKLLDIAGTVGEFSFALFEEMVKLGIEKQIIADSIYSIPKSSICYELIRKLYVLLGLNIKNISTFTSFDLVKYVNDFGYDSLTKLLSQRKDFCSISVDDEIKGDENMINFEAVVGNPPYQGVNHSQIYPYFYLAATKLGSNVCLIFPVGWQEPKNANNLRMLNNKEIKEDKQIVLINNVENVFPGISGAEWVNIVFWQKNYNNGLNGKQKVLTNFNSPETINLIYDVSQIVKPKEIVELAEKVTNSSNFSSIQNITSTLKPYGLRTDVIHKDGYKKYDLKPIYVEKKKTTDIKIYCKQGILRYVPRDYAFPKNSIALAKYKVFVPYAWGNMSEQVGLGGAFSDIIIASPYEACTETYLESGCFNDFATAKKHAKFLLTKFARACLYRFKYSQHSTTAWGAVPIQDYHEDWWDLSIDQIDEHLMDKYNLSDKVKKFIRTKFQTKKESNITNFK